MDHCLEVYSKPPMKERSSLFENVVEVIAQLAKPLTRGREICVRGQDSVPPLLIDFRATPPKFLHLHQIIHERPCAA